MKSFALNNPSKVMTLVWFGESPAFSTGTAVIVPSLLLNFAVMPPDFRIFGEVTTCGLCLRTQRIDLLLECRVVGSGGYESVIYGVRAVKGNGLKRRIRVGRVFAFRGSDHGFGHSDLVADKNQHYGDNSRQHKQSPPVIRCSEDADVTIENSP